MNTEKRKIYYFSGNQARELPPPLFPSPLDGEEEDLINQRSLGLLNFPFFFDLRQSLRGLGGNFLDAAGFPSPVEGPHHFWVVASA